MCGQSTKPRISVTRVILADVRWDGRSIRRRGDHLAFEPGTSEISIETATAAQRRWLTYPTRKPITRNRLLGSRHSCGVILELGIAFDGISPFAEVMTREMQRIGLSTNTSTSHALHTMHVTIAGPSLSHLDAPVYGAFRHAPTRLLQTATLAVAAIQTKALAGANDTPLRVSSDPTAPADVVGLRDVVTGRVTRSNVGCEFTFCLNSSFPRNDRNESRNQRQ